MYQIISSKCLKFGRFLKPLCQASTPSSKLVEWIIEDGVQENMEIHQRGRCRIRCESLYHQ
ncbi:unnamed protein product [Acanthoscelides obtectus]|uniref:Uncharacterized protein n=1 Tax=Acanthoscelides obtectus TaxID=200917 RepID=A0A9P0LJZ3_ACAOB|nr:unnamed protein product [Acanthoscelides obtectus]CAK1630895.1 hypothetical protein AOBTE_LOCUS6623 [Acanthoscelides obtectus]